MSHCYLQMMWIKKENPEVFWILAIVSETTTQIYQEKKSHIDQLKAVAE